MIYDASDHDAEGNWEIGGSSLATPLWLAMGIKIPGRIVVQRNNIDCELESLMDLLSVGLVEDIGSAHINTILHDNGDGGYNVERTFTFNAFDLQRNPLG